MKEYRLKAYRYGKRIAWAIVLKEHGATKEDTEREARRKIAEDIKTNFDLDLKDVVLEGKWV